MPPRNVGQIEYGLERGFIKSHWLNSVKLTKLRRRHTKPSV